MLNRALLAGILLATATLAASSTASASPPLPAAVAAATVTANAIGHPIILDGEVADWEGVAGTVVPLSGHGGADSVELRAAIRDDRIYLLAIWDDPSENKLHKPYRWNEASQTYEKTEQMEDRFALSMRMSGDFTANKLDGSEFTADVWHWKANRSNPVGLAHDKWWRVSRTPFEGSRAFETPSGEVVHLHRPSDAGDRLYKPVRYYVKEGEIMPLYEVNSEARGSIADVQANGAWRDGRWYLELSRLLDTGHDDDAVIPANGTIPFAVALFDGVSNNIVDGGAHSVSELLVLETRAASS
jgi:Ethylbenzene dehydrogenase